MQEYLNNGELEAIGEYLNRYGESLPDDSLIRFCENAAANAVLLYFAQQAKNNRIDYIVKAKIPADIFVSETDISVLFGNLLENALDACKTELSDDKKIIVRAELTENSLCVAVDNTIHGNSETFGYGKAYLDKTQRNRPRNTVGKKYRRKVRRRLPLRNRGRNVLCVRPYFFKIIPNSKKAGHSRSVLLFLL